MYCEQKYMEEFIKGSNFEDYDFVKFYIAVLLEVATTPWSQWRVKDDRLQPSVWF